MSSQTGNPAQLQDVVDALARANCKPRKNGNGYTAFCPVHEADGHDHSPSLNFEAGKKADVVMKCHAGCDYHQIRAALGLEPAKLNGKRRRIDATYHYRDASGKAAFEKIRYEPKDFRIRHRDASGAEVWKLPSGVEPPLYRLPDIMKAIAQGEPVYLVEGEKDADRLAAAGLCATTNYDGAAKGNHKPKWRDSYTAALAGADVVLLPDNDEPGHAHMRHIAKQLAGVARSVRILELPELAAKGDVSDWLNAGHTIAELAELATTAPDGTTGHTDDATTAPDDDDAVIARLAALDPLEYDRQRADAARKLGVRSETLDKAVKEERGEPDKASNGDGAALDFPDVEPWPERVDGAELLTDLTASVKRFMSLSAASAEALALWVLYSYIVVRHGHVAPMLAVTSPEKRCGKSTLLGWLYRLVDRPLLAANITAAAIFRTVDVHQPTLLIDEADSFLGESGDELRGILNSGHTRDTAYVIRCTGENSEPRKFCTWGAKAVALIGKLQGKYSTLADRSIEIQLRRKLPTERLTKLRHAEPDHFERLSRRCARFTADHGAAIGRARPDIPDMNDRAMDNWEPLLAIADKAGGTWPQKARTVALSLSGKADKEEIGGFGVQLLTDLRAHFEKHQTTRSFATNALLAHLNGLEESPWPTFAKGEKPMTARHLSRLLEPYGIGPHPTRINGTVTKGYEVDHFADAFARYLDFIGYTVTTQSTSGFPPDSLSVTDPPCNRYATDHEASEQAACNRVTDRTALSGQGERNVTDDARVTELIAAGYAPWNAKAKADSERRWNPEQDSVEATL